MSQFGSVRGCVNGFGCDMSYLERSAESCDVTIRCYLLGQAISEVLDEVERRKEE